MLPTTMPLKQTTANTKKTKKTLNGNHQSYLKYTTTAWICQTYAPVFQSIARLKNLATCLLDKMSILLNKQTTDTPQNPTHPITSTPNQKPLHPPYKLIQSQPQRSFLFPPLPLPTAKHDHSNQPRAKCRLTQTIADLFESLTAALETFTSHTVPNLLIKMPTQTHQQKPDPQQTHYRCQKHTKHQHSQRPQLLKPHLHHNKCLPSSVTSFPPTYHRYLAHNFQPP